MRRVDPSIWAKAVADALFVGPERVPFERVLQQYQVEVDALRCAGLTWQSLAQCLLTAGVRRPDTRPYSADHLRVCCLRLKARASIRSAPASRKPRQKGASAANAAVRKPASNEAPLPEILRAPTRPMPPASAHETEDKDVSTEELAAVRARLQSFR